jgi:hypothetical protein
MESDSLWEELSDIFGKGVEVDTTTMRHDGGQWTAHVIRIKKRPESRRSENR